MTSIFSRIVDGEIPAYKIFEDDRFMAFLDVFPVAKGHTLVIPKVEIDNVFDIEEKLYIDYMSLCKKIAVAIAKAVPCKRVGSAIVGLEIPHAHVHLIPLNEIADLNFEKEKLIFTKSEFEEIAGQIRKYLERN